MAYFGISRPPDLPRRCSAPPAHDAWNPRLYTGSLTLSLDTEPGRFVTPATGRLVLASLGEAEIVALEAARSGGVPVLPGSGIKGAVRTVYELLSHSCDPFAKGRRCEVKASRGRGKTDFEVCEACSLFGCLGWTGRMTFSDATPTADSVTISVEKVPLPWKPNADKTEGDFRFYDHGQTRTREGGLAPKKLAREVYQGQFETQMTFWNAAPEELGRLLLAMGWAPGKNRFHLRLGGVKYDGQGGLAVTPLSCRLVHPMVKTLSGAELVSQCEDWLTAGANAEAFRPFQKTLERLGAELAGGRP